MQLLLDPEVRAAELEAIRAQLDAHGVRDVRPAHVEWFYELAAGDRALAAEALESIAAGKVHEPLRDLLARARS